MDYDWPSSIGGDYDNDLSTDDSGSFCLLNDSFDSKDASKYQWARKIKAKSKDVHLRKKAYKVIKKRPTQSKK